MDGDNMIVLECRDQSCLAQKPPPRLQAGGQNRVHGLKSDAPLQPKIFRLEDDPHAPLTEDA
jgi:hypothetical protein